MKEQPTLADPSAATFPMIYILDVKDCPRCGGNHVLSVARFRRQSPAFFMRSELEQVQKGGISSVRVRALTWWGVCPMTKEPVFADDSATVTEAIR